MGGERQLKVFRKVGKVSDKEMNESEPFDEASLAKLASHIKTKVFLISWDNG